MTYRIKLPAEVLEEFKKAGKKGGDSRARKHSLAQLSEWGKLGGRPKGSCAGTQSGSVDKTRSTTKKGFTEDESL